MTVKAKPPRRRPPYDGERAPIPAEARAGRRPKLGILTDHERRCQLRPGRRPTAPDPDEQAARAKLGVRPAGTKKPRHEGPEFMCWAQLRKRPGTHCRNPLGYKTPHVGQGRCWLHGGLAPIKTGLHSLVKHARLRDLIAQLEQTDQQLMDLEPETKLMRALVIDFVNRYDEFIDKLDTWYDALDINQRTQDLPPIPRRYPDLEDASKLIEAVSRIAERQHKITREGSVTLDVFRGLMAQMGLIVAKHVEDDKALARIEDEWSKIMVDPKSFVRGSHGTSEDAAEDDDE